MFRPQVPRSILSLTPRRLLALQSSAAEKSAQKTAAHIEYLLKFYNPKLLQSIKITESLVSPKDYVDLKKRGDSARSRLAPDVNADLSKTDPEWDEPIMYPNQGINATPYPRIPQMQALDNLGMQLRFKEKDAIRGPSKRSRFQFFEELHKLTGMDVDYMRLLYMRPIHMKRVSCQTSKGKIPNFFCITVVGDRNGMLGLGQGKSRDGMRTALEKAHWDAIKNLQPIPRYEKRTIVGEMNYKYHAVKLFMKPAPPGYGLRVNHNIFEICQAAGIKDLSGKVYKSRNSMNVIKGFIEALTKQRSLEDLAAGRGKKVVDLRKVYYSA
ncbi:hypothetical protein PUMCH_003655 [Australozyma saopauloensis]|uniref:Small ribosomal subunit protein uS5m n=1 Tax=Australozyma saopauloensis TaxID=291208 RepID=A0AAX4HCM3_9ASCO|nr:hypothetical protein PUMCH_003655 [[Candida] saopauloensis]